MIKSLVVKNIALIDSLEVNFQSGLTVLTGETGSGKSIIVDSLGFVLGDRADKTLIKYGEDFAEVCALFEVEADSPVVAKLDSYGYGNDVEILISRRMSAAGKNEIRIQGRPATLAILREVCSELADIFGQGQHLALLDVKNQLGVLDSFCNFNGVDKQLADEYARLCALNRELKSLGGSDSERERSLDVLRYQIEEIENADVSQEEEDNLLAQHKRMVNAERISEAVGAAAESLGGELGAASLLAHAAAQLRQISPLEQSAESLSQRISAAQLDVDDVCESLRDILTELEFSPAEADRVEGRLETIRQLKRKYGGSIAEVLDFLQQARGKYEMLVNASERIAQLCDEKNAVLRKMYSLAQAKSAERQRAAQQLADNIMRELAELGMRGTKFAAEFQPQPTFEQYCESASADGFDKIEFVMSANVGEPLKPLAKVISGGEMSRFMLAVKNITALAEKIPTMVFDEIDTGISGNMAQMVAQKLANVSADDSGYQCIVITHLPQIAAMADANYRISKIERDGKTFTVLQPLADEDDRAREIARLMGGVGEHALVNAKELLAFAADYKSKL